MRSRSWIFAVALGLAVSAGTMGCSDDDDTSNAGSSGSSGGTTGTLYDRLGKKEGIAKALTAIVDAELKDPDIASYFFAQVATPVPAGAPTRAQIEECLTLQLSNAAGGPETYPATVSGGFTCRDMVASHKHLGIPAGTFDNFVSIAAGVLKGAGVADADITTIGTVLNGTKSQIVTDTTRDKGPFLGAADGGT